MLRRFGIYAGAHTAKDVEPVRVRSFETLGITGQQGFGGDRNPEIGRAPAKLGSEETGRRHADDGEEMAVDLIAGANDGRIGAPIIGADKVRVRSKAQGA